MNDSYVWYGARLLESLQRNWPDHPLVLVQHTGLTEDSRRALSRFPRILFHQADGSIQGPPINLIAGADTQSAYLRLNLWGTSFDDYDNILYLDADTIVLKPLNEILDAGDLKIFKDPITTTAGMFIDGKDSDLQKTLAEDQLVLGQEMANTGVFVIPKKWRQEDNFLEMMDLLDRYRPYLRFSDQTVINLWMIKHGCLPVEDIRFNYLVKQPPAMLRRVGIENIRVLHFAGFAEQSARRKLLIRLALCLASGSLTRYVYAVIQQLLLEFGPNYRDMPNG